MPNLQNYLASSSWLVCMKGLVDNYNTYFFMLKPNVLEKCSNAVNLRYV